MAILINGRKVAKRENQRTEQVVRNLARQGLVPELAVVLVGDDPASLLYIRMKDRMAKRLGLRSVVNHLPKSISERQLIKIIHDYNKDPKVNGILVQSPLPNHISERNVDYEIDPVKDVDGFNPVNIGKLLLNETGFYPIACTPLGIITLLKEYRVRLKSANVVIIGASQIVGRPLLALMLNFGATVRIIDVNTKDKDLAKYTTSADVVISATGQINLITGSDLKSGCTVIDVGENHNTDGKLVGDVNFTSAKRVAEKITPVPGGVGPMTISTLMKQTVKLCKVQHHLK